MAQSDTLSILKASGKPLRAVDVVARASEGKPKKVSAGLIGRDLKKLAEKGQAKQNEDRTWEAVSEPKTPGPQGAKERTEALMAKGAEVVAKAPVSHLETRADGTEVVADGPLPMKPKEVRLRVNVTKGAETGHTDSGVDGPYTDAVGHDVNTGHACKKCAALLAERRAASQAEAGPSKAEVDEMVLDTLDKVDEKSPLFVAMALGRAGKITVREMPLVMESFRRLAKAGRLRKA